MPAWRRWTVLTGVFLFCLLGHLDCEGQKEATVRQGENATLECYGRSGATDILLRWEKHDQQIEGYVFYFKDRYIQEPFQDPSFKGRVELKDPEWKKTGNFSVILKSVTMNDTGRYECYAGYNNQKPELINSTNLKIEEEGQTGGHTEDGGKEDGEKSGSVGLRAGLVVPAVLLVVVVAVFLIYRKHNKQNQDSATSYQTPVEMHHD